MTTRVDVFTDGACFDNGRDGATAGVGVYWGENHPMNYSAPLEEGRQTNNRAEIEAATVACQQAKEMGYWKLRIFTDSDFLIRSMTEWLAVWKQNGWINTYGETVINRRDFERLERKMEGLDVKWVHVRAHMGIPGNEAADRLAYRGAKQRHSQY